MDLSSDTMCFVCGKDNPIGLKLEFAWEGKRYKTRFTPGAEHQSYMGVMHGGLISTVLDEVMGKMLFVQGINAMTARLEIRFRRPAGIGQTLVFWGEIGEDRGKLLEMRAAAEDANGKTVAEAKATFMRV